MSSTAETGSFFKIAEARQAFRSALEADPASAVALTNLAELDSLDGLYKRAATRYAKAIAAMESGRCPEP